MSDSDSKDGSKMDVDQKAPKAEDDEVVAEMDCYHIPLNRHHFSAATLQFQTEKAAKMQDCVARMKPIVKHLEIDFQKNTDRDDGINNYGPATFSGKATSESEVLNHALGFVKDGKMYFVEIDDNYKMRRLVNKNSEDVVEEGPDVKRNLSPVRVKFARAETDAQRKRREQSSYFKSQQAAQEAWKAVPIVHEDPSYPLKILDQQIEDEIIPRNRSNVKLEVDDSD